MKKLLKQLGFKKIEKCSGKSYDATINNIRYEGITHVNSKTTSNKRLKTITISTSLSYTNISPL